MKTQISFLLLSSILITGCDSVGNFDVKVAPSTEAASAAAAPVTPPACNGASSTTVDFDGTWKSACIVDPFIGSPYYAKFELTFCDGDMVYKYDNFSNQTDCDNLAYYSRSSYGGSIVDNHNGTINDTYTTLEVAYPAGRIAWANAYGSGAGMCSITDWAADVYRDVTSDPCSVGALGVYTNSSVTITGTSMDFEGIPVVKQ